MKLSPVSLVLLVAAALAGCGDSATLPLAAGMGPRPQLPPPHKTLVPTVNCFIPKPHTPFETEELEDPESLRAKLARLDAAFRKMPNVTFRGMPVVEAIWEAYLAKMGLESVPILRQAAAGTPVRRLVKEHHDTVMAVVRPGRADAASRGVFDPKLRRESPWGFVAKS